MSDTNGYLRVQEFDRAMKALERQLNTGFERIDTRLHRLEEGGTRDAERLAVLEADRKQDTKKTMSWTAALVAVATALAEVVRRTVVGG